MSTGFHLLDNPNPNPGSHFYDNRRACQHGRNAPHLVVAHTAESLPDFEGDDASGEALARYASTTTRSVSWHATVDADSTIAMLPDDYTAFHVRGYNRCALGMEIATKASFWVEGAQKYPSWYNAIMGQAANQVAWWCKTYQIPAIRLTKAEADAGNLGVIDHARLDPSRRSDPGPDFAWSRFLVDVNARLSTPGYLDRPEWPAWAAASIQKAIDKGVMVGDGKLWMPGKEVTRAELALVLDRMGVLGA